MLEININAAIPYLNTNLAFANMHHQPFTLKFPNISSSMIFQETAKDMMSVIQKIRV